MGIAGGAGGTESGIVGYAVISLVGVLITAGLFFLLLMRATAMRKSPTVEASCPADLHDRLETVGRDQGFLGKER